MHSDVVGAFVRQKGWNRFTSCRISIMCIMMMLTFGSFIRECHSRSAFATSDESSFSKGLPSYRFGHCKEKLMKTAKDMKLKLSAHDALGLYICKKTELRIRTNEERTTFPGEDEAMSTDDEMLSIPLLQYELHLAYAPNLSVKRIEKKGCEVTIYDSDTATVSTSKVSADFYSTRVSRSLLEECFQVKNRNQDPVSKWTVRSSTSERATVIASEGNLAFDRVRRFFHNEQTSSSSGVLQRAYDYVARKWFGDISEVHAFEHITVDVVSPSRTEMGRMKLVYLGKRSSKEREPLLKILAVGACSGVLIYLQRLSATRAFAEVFAVGALRDCEISGTVALNVGLLAIRMLTKEMSTRVTLLDVAHRHCVLDPDSMRTLSLEASLLNVVLTGTTIYGGFRGFKPDPKAIIDAKGLRSHEKQHMMRRNHRYGDALAKLSKEFGVEHEADVFTGIERLKATNVFSTTDRTRIDDALSTLSTSTDTIDADAPGSFRKTMRHLSDCAFGRVSRSGASPLPVESSKCCSVLYMLIEYPDDTRSLMYLLKIATSHAANKEMTMRPSTEVVGDAGLYARTRTHK
eukprot:g911.t1